MADAPEAAALDFVDVTTLVWAILGFSLDEAAAFFFPEVVLCVDPEEPDDRGSADHAAYRLSNDKT